MNRIVVPLKNETAKNYACKTIMQAPENWRMELRPRTRSLDQNSLMWSVLTDISKQVDWPINGVNQKLSPEDWKDILSASLTQENRIAQGLQGGFVMLGQRTSKMTVKQMTDLITLAHSFGAEHDVKWSKTSVGSM